MELKKITILFVPEDTNRVRQVSIHRILLVISVLFILSSGTYLFVLTGEYHSIKLQIPRLTLLERERTVHKRQLAYLGQRINHMTRKMEEISELDQRLRAMMNLEENKENAQFMGVGGSPSFSYGPSSPDQVSTGKGIREMHRSLDGLKSRVTQISRSKTDLYYLLENQKTLLACTPSIWPVRGWLSSTFGHRISPFTNEKEFHKGIDISTKMNTDVVAPADGVVIYIGRKSGYGNFMHLNHGYGLVTRYAHLRKALVKEGQRVRRGEKIALAGSTGRSTGPHLHYEVHRSAVPVDPLLYMIN